jgi:hypothetical protein
MPTRCVRWQQLLPSRLACVRHLGRQPCWRHAHALHSTGSPARWLLYCLALPPTLQYDVCIIITFPETHTLLANDLLYGDLPRRSAAARARQRFIVVVHNPDKVLARAMARRFMRDEALQVADRLPQPEKLVQKQKQRQLRRLAKATESDGVEAAAAVPAGLAQAGEQDAAQAEATPLAPQRLVLLTLAPFTSTYTEELLQQWSRDAPGGPPGRLHVPWVSPLSPWRPSFSPKDIRHADATIFAGNNSVRHLCIQASRRCVGCCTVRHARPACWRAERRALPAQPAHCLTCPPSFDASLAVAVCVCTAAAAVAATGHHGS